MVLNIFQKLQCFGSWWKHTALPRTRPPRSPGVVGHSRQNRKIIHSLIVEKLCILYFRHQRSCLEISKLLDSACCWKAHTYPCISLSYYLVMGENDPSLEIYSAVKSTSLSRFIPLAEKTRIPLSTQFGVNWFSFHQKFFLNSEETWKPDLWRLSKWGPKSSLGKTLCVGMCSNVQKCPHKWNDTMKWNGGCRMSGLGYVHKAAQLQLSVLDLKPAFQP